MDIARTELLIVTLARLLQGVRTIAVGNSSPIPGAASLLLRARDSAVRVLMLGSVKNNAFTDGGRELFDCASQGRIDAFFLGGGQIDGQANLNLVGVGDYPKVSQRFPGSFGSAYLYFLVPRVILFREEHTPRVLVPKVDFISAPGTSENGVYRPGGPAALVTQRCVFGLTRTSAASVSTASTPARASRASVPTPASSSMSPPALPGHRHPAPTIWPSCAGWSRAI
jgi:glutaconate CoA-transferase, subunit B